MKIKLLKRRIQSYLHNTYIYIYLRDEYIPTYPYKHHIWADKLKHKECDIFHKQKDTTKKEALKMNA